MHYGFDAYPLLYVAAALAIFGLPMTCIFLAAMRAGGGTHYKKVTPQLRSTQPSVAQTPVPVKRTYVAAPVMLGGAAIRPPKQPKIVRKRALKIEWVSLPVEIPTITPRATRADDLTLGSNNP